MNIIISGATRGIGRAIAKELATKNHRLILIARNSEDLEELKKELEENTSVKIFSCDLSNMEESKQLKDRISSLSETDVLINNLGIFETNPADQIQLDELQKMLDVNLYSAINLSSLIVEDMKNKENGVIINMASVMAHMAAPFAANYSISKHAFKGWNDALREELRQHGIRVCAIYPGAVNTSSWDGIEVNRDAMIQPEDIAKLVASLLEMNYNTLVEEIKLSPLKF